MTTEQEEAAIAVLVEAACEEHESSIRHLQEAYVDLSARVVRLEAEALASLGRDQAFQARFAEVEAGAKKAAEEGKAEAVAMVSSALSAFSSELTQIRGATEASNVALEELKQNIEQSVLRALQKHVTKIEKAADALTKAPQVKTAAALAGTFTGGAIATIVIEIAKRLGGH